MEDVSFLSFLPHNIVSNQYFFVSNRTQQ